MGEKNLIYSITFHSQQEVSAEGDRQVKGTTSETDNSYNLTAEEYFKQLEENTKYVLNMEKSRNKDTFIKAVKHLAETLEIDTDIYKKEWGYIANVKVRSLMIGEGVYRSFILKALLSADSFQITTVSRNQEYDFILSLCYNTHDRYYKGEKRN